MLQPALLTAASLALACALLSVVVVQRRWAFIGEGIAHAGFGGVATAWALAIAFPSVGLFRTHSGIYAVAVLFCLAASFGIAFISRRSLLFHADTAIGIFLVGSLAWGFAVQAAYRHFMNADPPDWENYLLGDFAQATWPYAFAAFAASAACVGAVLLLKKEIIAYCFDPLLAQLSGVRANFIHHLLITLLALLIILGMRLMGSLLMTALLVLPAATALRLARHLPGVVLGSLAAGLIAAFAGPLLHEVWRFIPIGPLIALSLLAEFLIASLIARFQSPSAPS